MASKLIYLGPPGNPVVKASSSQCRGRGFDPSGELDPTWGAVRLGGIKLVYPLDFLLKKKDEHSFLILAEKKILVRKKKKP